MMTFGERMAMLRKDRGLRQKELAAFLNVSVAVVSHYEKDDNEPDIDTLIKIAKFYSVSTDYLLGLSDIPSAPVALEERFLPGIKYKNIFELLQYLSDANREHLYSYLAFLAAQSSRPFRKDKR